MSLKIYSYPNNPRVNKALIAASYYGVTIETTPNFQMGVDNQTTEFKAMNPNGKVPVLQTPEGAIFESAAIARYVARLGDKSLYGKTVFESGQIDQWVDWCQWNVDLPAMAWLYPIRGFVPDNQNRTKKAKGDIRKALQILNDHLKTRTFLVGERISLADIYVSCSLYPLYQTVLDPGFRNSFAHTNRWFLTCINQPNFLKVIGTIELTKKMQVAKSEPVEQPKKEEPKKEQPKKEAKKEQPKKEQPKKEVEPKEEEEEEPKEVDERDQVYKEWEKNLPKSAFNLEEWKRFYSNNKDTKGVAMPWFWEHLDDKAFSIYHVTYKYPEELTTDLLAINLAGGFTQRLTNAKVNKFGFGNLLVLGSGPFELKGAFVLRGTDSVPPMLEDVTDYSSFNFTKIDHKDENQRKLVADYWAWDGNFGGLAFDGYSVKTLK
jgi:elongation factor 1-gamma